MGFILQGQARLCYLIGSWASDSPPLIEIALESQSAKIESNKMKALTEVQTSFKAKLETVAKAMKRDWWKQDVMHVVTGVTFLDLCEVKDQTKRDEIMAKWIALDSSLGGIGTNCSQLTKTLGRPEKVDMLGEAIKGF